MDSNTRRFDLDRVVQAALDLLDEDPSATLSVRGVAARLGVRPNALYTYVADRAALERAVADRLLGEADPALLSGRPPWPRRIEAYACALRRVLLARPAAAPVLLTAPMDGPNAALVGERLLGSFTAAGLRPADAARATYALIVYVLGSVALTAAEPEPDEAARRERLSAVDPDVLPLTAETAAVAARWNSEEQFRWGLRRLLAGLAPPRSS
jgi:AcrR family transcriptional regulator